MVEPALIAMLAFPIAFIGIFAFVITLVGELSGWKRVERRFPDRPDVEFASFRFQSATMGAGARMNNILTFTACQNGLRVAKWPLFGPTHQAFFVPWTELRVKRGRMPLQAIAILDLGSPPETTLKISAALADKLAAAAPDQWPEGATPRQAPPIVS